MGAGAVAAVGVGGGLVMTASASVPDNGHEGGLLYLKCDKKKIAKGVRAHLTMEVTPDETHDSTDTQASASASAS
ncbi:hypothetical protein ACWC09_03515 [Streptomyces sp. NPDC001617]